MQFRCSHCTRFAPTYELVAEQLHTQRDNPSRTVKVAKIDGAAERALSSRFSVRGFPTFFLVDGWTVREYEGNRSQENLVKFAMDPEEVEPMPFLFGPFGPMVSQFIINLFQFLHSDDQCRISQTRLITLFVRDNCVPS